MKLYGGKFIVELFKHSLILSFTKNKKIFRIGASDYLYHLVFVKQGKLLRQKLESMIVERFGNETVHAI